MARKKASKKTNMVSVDLSDVDSSSVLDDGDYAFEVISAEIKTSDTSGMDYIFWTVKEVETGTTVWHNTSLGTTSLFFLRNFLESCGVEIPDSRFDLDLDAVIGAIFGASVTTEVYNNKPKNVLDNIFPAENLEGEDDTPEPEPEPVKKTAAKKTKGKIKKGSEVTFEDDGETVKGIVDSISGNTVGVVVGDEIWELDLGDLTGV